MKVVLSSRNFDKESANVVEIDHKNLVRKNYTPLELGADSPPLFPPHTAFPQMAMKEGLYGKMLVPNPSLNVQKGKIFSKND